MEQNHQQFYCAFDLGWTIFAVVYVYDGCYVFLCDLKGAFTEIKIVTFFKSFTEGFDEVYFLGKEDASFNLIFLAGCYHDC